MINIILIIWLSFLTYKVYNLRYTKEEIAKKKKEKEKVKSEILHIPSPAEHNIKTKVENNEKMGNDTPIEELICN